MRPGEIVDLIEKRQRELGPILLISTLIALSTAIVYIWLVIKNCDFAKISSIYRWFFCVPLVAIPIVYLSFLVWQGKRLRHKYGLVCPNCGYLYSLSDPKEAILNKCEKCGKELFDLDVKKQDDDHKNS